MGVCVLGLTMLLFLALVTDGYQGRIRRPLDGMSEVDNLLGWPGAMVAGFLCMLLGGAAHAVYCITGVWGGILIRHGTLDRLAARAAGLMLVVFGVASLLHVDFASASEAGAQAVPVGGMIGAFFGDVVLRHFGIIGANVIALTVTVVGVLLSTEFLFVRLLDRLRVVAVLVLRATAHALGAMGRLARQAMASRKKAPGRDARDDEAEFPIEEVEPPRIRIRPGPADSQALREEREEEFPFDEVPAVEPDSARAEAVEPDDGAAEASEEAAEESAAGEPGAPAARGNRKPPLPRRKNAYMDELPPDYVYPKRYTCPSLDLFDPPPEGASLEIGDQLLKTSALLEERLLTFGIEARVTDVTRGPTITLYELEPAPG
ncbi:MAG: DNA translocase FtsK 4TM domain-containing protein, partial [Candidatus Hydrogenedentes bacterium]|nr:DNA translocase FtsK 4TM domain-containing protein [Candidatus Hydrogenedentota bacterium]